MTTPNAIFLSQLVSADESLRRAARTLRRRIRGGALSAVETDTRLRRYAGAGPAVVVEMALEVRRPDHVGISWTLCCGHDGQVWTVQAESSRTRYAPEDPTVDLSCETLSDFGSHSTNDDEEAVRFLASLTDRLITDITDTTFANL